MYHTSWGMQSSFFTYKCPAALIHATETDKFKWGLPTRLIIQTNSYSAIITFKFVLYSKYIFNVVKPLTFIWLTLEKQNTGPSLGIGDQGGHLGCLLERASICTFNSPLTPQPHWHQISSNWQRNKYHIITWPHRFGVLMYTLSLDFV